MYEAEEQKFLNNYNPSKYNSIFVATDVVAFSIKSEMNEEYRRVPQRTFRVLMVRRGEYPYKGQWALPGGFVLEDETVENTALRELREETGVSDAYMEQLYTFSVPNRDPRARIVSVTYLALLNQEPNLSADTDVVDTAWFQVDYRMESEEVEDIGKGACKKQYWKLQLNNEQTHLEAEICITKEMEGQREKVEYEVHKSQDIAFDHAKIIAVAIQRLRGKIDYTDIAFHLLPKLFTLKTLQSVYEVILDKKLIDANFRRKMEPFVQETTMSEQSGSRMAKLYQRKLES